MTNRRTRTTHDVTDMTDEQFAAWLDGIAEARSMVHANCRQVTRYTGQNGYEAAELKRAGR